jgi:hypothetical protein
VILWSVDPEDWSDRDTARQVAHITGRVEDGDIILLHDIYPASVDTALQTVDELLGAKEVLISSSSAPGLRCVEIDGKPVGRQAPEVVAALQKWVKDEIFAATELD